MVLGGHGDNMVPVLSYCTVNGVPRRASSSPRTSSTRSSSAPRNGGGEIVKLMGTSAYYAPASAAIAMAEATCATRSACCRAPRTSRASTATRTSTWACRSSSAPAASRRSSTIELTADEKAMLDKTAAAVRELIEAVEEALTDAAT